MRFAKELDLTQNIIHDRFKHPLWFITERISGTRKKIQESSDYISQFAYDIIKKKREKQGKENNEEDDDLLDMFMNTVNDDGEKLSDKELKDIILNLITAGKY